MYSINARQKNSKKRLLIIAFIALLIAIVIGYFFYQKSNTPEAEKKTTTKTASGVNLDPPTEQEKEAANDQKTENIKRDEAVSSTPKTTTPSIVVVDADQYGNTIEVRAYISNLYENNGTCTATFTKAGTKVSKSSSGFKDATTTQCTPINIARSEFPQAGEWKYTVSYQSAAGSGSTNEKTITIQ